MSEAKKQRACLLCSQIKSYAQFRKDGCENCEEVLSLRGNSDKIVDCTTTNFNGMISMMDIHDSWVSRWQRIDRFVPGVYAIQVYGRLPEDVAIDLEERGYSYRPRDGNFVLIFIYLMAFCKSPFQKNIVSDWRVEGNGSYKFEDGTIYNGSVKNGEFHGEGTITFPNGDKINGIWKNGNLITRELVFSDGLRYKESAWDYCSSHSDRRLQSEILKGVYPAGTQTPHQNYNK